MNKKNKNCLYDSKNIDICFVSPSLLEAGKSRGGGIEEIDYEVSIQLSNLFNVVIISPFFKNFKGNIIINNYFSIDEVFFPAVRNYPKKSNVECFITYIIKPLYTLLVIRKIILMKKMKLKLLIVHNGQVGLFSAIIAKLLGINILYSEGNAIPWTSPYLFSTNRKLLKKLGFYINAFMGILIFFLADSVRAQSNSIKEGMVKLGLNPAKIYVIGGGVDIDSFNLSALDVTGGGIIRVGFLGRLSVEKGVTLLLEIVQNTLSLQYIHFIIMGDGPYKHRFAAMPNVEHIGWVNRNELNSWLGKVDVLLFFQEELGLGELQALAAGKPIIFCNRGEIHKLIKNMENGLLCEPNPNSYISAIKILYGDSLLRERLSINARLLAETNFSWHAIGNKWIDLCNKILLSGKNER